MIKSPVQSLIVYKIGLNYKYVFVKKLYALNAEPLVFEPAGVQSCARFYTGHSSLSSKRRHRGSWPNADPEANQKDLARDLSGADISQAVLQDADRGDRQHAAGDWF
jgi:hypothetical protein